MDVTEDTGTPADETEEQTPSAPIQNRFLFVDVAALRAKQLRRGALPRLEQLDADEKGHRPDAPLKLERVAMEEVRRGIIPHELPDLKTVMKGDA